MALSVAQLSEHLIRSGLLPEEQIKASAQSVGGLTEDSSAEGLAKQLVRDGRLTLFQAQLAVNGKAAALILGSYLILEKLGQGGMGQVYKARHRTMKREVALKVISAAVLKDETSLRRFQREVEAAAQLNHPNIVTAHDAGEHKGTHFLVMELVRGADLASIVKKSGPMKAALAVRCVLQAARGLAYAHSNGIVHRDIKPANLLLDESNTIKILDMGLARFEEAGEDHASVAGLTGTGMLMGTIDYMSPEQAMDSKTADARSDIYSLGCTLYYLLSGQAVYVEDTVMKRIMAHQSAAIPRLPILDNHLQVIFERMIAKKPEQRYQSTEELANDLQRWLTTIESDRVKATAEMPMLSPSLLSIPDEVVLKDDTRKTSVQTLQPPQESPRDTMPSSSSYEQTMIPGSQNSDDPQRDESGRKTGPHSISSDATTPRTPSNPDTQAISGSKKLAAIASGNTSSGSLESKQIDPSEETPQATPIINVSADSSPSRRRTGSKRLPSEVRQPPRKPPLKKILAAAGGGALGLVLLGIIVITLRNKDGRETVIRIPEGTTISVDPGTDGSVDIASVSEDTAKNDRDMQDDSVRADDSPSPNENVVPDWVLTAENNSALRFRDGSVEFPTLTFDKLPQWTIEFQVSRAADSRADEETLLSTFGQSDSRAMVLRIWGDDCVFGIFEGRSSMYKDLRLATMGLFGRETTHHVAIAFDGLTQTLYFDGQPQGSAAPEQPALSPKPLCLGNLASGHDPRAAFRGWVDELRVSNIVRYTAAYEPQRRLAADSDTIALYHFDEGRGDRLHDISGHGHHGIIQNAEWISLSSDGLQPHSNSSTTVADGTNAATAMSSNSVPSADASAGTSEAPGSNADPAGILADGNVVSMAGTLASAELRLKERTADLPPFKNVLRPGQPLGEFAAVSSPGKVENVISWSIEPLMHRSMFRCIDVSSEGLMATGGTDNSVRIWTKDWQLIRVLPGHANAVSDVAFSPNGKVLASVSTLPHAMLALWDVKSGQLIAFHDVNHWNGQLAWMPDGERVARGTPEGLEIMNIRSGDVRKSDPTRDHCHGVAVSPDGNRIFCTIYVNAPQIFETASLKSIQTIENFSSGFTDWSRDGKWIAIGNEQRTLVLDTRSFQVRAELSYGAIVKFSPDSTMLALASVGKTAIINSKDWSLIRELPIHVSYAFEWSADGRQLHTSNGSYDVQTGQPMPHPMLSATSPVVSAVSSDGRRVATISNARLRLWDGANGQLVNETVQNQSGASQLLWQPNGSKILKVIFSRESIPTPITILDGETGKTLNSPTAPLGTIYRAAWSPDGKQFASVGEDGLCRIWDASSATELQKFSHADPIWWVQWSNDGTKVATGSSFSAISVWDVAAGKVIREFKTLSKPMQEPRSLSAADGPFGFLKGDTQLFYMAGDHGFEVLDLKTGQISSLGQVDHIGGNRLSAAWSKDFGLLGIYNGYNEFHLYAAGDTKPVTSIRYFMNPHWLADGKRIFGGDNSSTWLCGYDLRRKKRMGVLIPELGTNSWAALSSDGHFVGSSDAKNHVVVVAMHRDGRLLTMTMEEFQTQFKWVNNPEKVRFID